MINFKPVHIGEEIKKVLADRGMTNRRLAQLIGTGERNIYTLFNNESINTNQLQNISVALNFNFFTFYYTSEDMAVLAESNAIYETKPEKGGVNITFNLGGENNEATNRFIEKMEDLLPEFLELEREKDQK